MDALVFAGGSVDTDWASVFLKKRKYELVICADRGVVHADRLGITPDLLLGDFDSAPAGILAKYSKVERISFPPEKDYTDMNLAIVEAMKRGASRIDCLGATGTRLDHTLANIDLLSLGEKNGVSITLYDAHNKISLCSCEYHIKSSEQFGKYVSILPYTYEACVSLYGMKYPLERGHIRRGESLTVSNEISGSEGLVRADEGTVLVFETRD
ncbi:MAG: thiamine diphosphokinase [Lachnospiraceae bacterium]|jgi:thiamine pyrophosphokinase